MDPGESLYCGGMANLQPNTNAGHKEEEEDLEDQHRRKLELGNLLSGAFDDLIENEEDDDDCSDRSGQSEDSPEVSPSMYYSYKTAASRQADNYAYENSADGMKPHRVMYQGQHTNIRHQQSGLSDGCSPEDDDLDDDPAYDMGTGRINGDGYSPTENHYYRNADLGSHEQLMVMYAARNREVKTLTEAVECLRQEKDSEIELLKRQLLVKETEKQAATLSHKEALNLLDGSKTQVSALQQEISQLRTFNLDLEKEKTELLKEVNLYKSSAADLQQKVMLLERNGNTTVPSEKQMESFYRTLQQRHQLQLREMQSQLENLAEKLKTKEGECIVLEEKLRNAMRGNDALQVSKGETVNKLAAQLEEAQKKLQKLSANSAVHETTKLKIMLEQTQSEKKALEEDLVALKRKLESAEKDLVQYESVRRLGLFDPEDSSSETDSITQLGISRRHSLGGRSEKHSNSRDSGRAKRSSLDQEDVSAKLKTELHRALQGQHSKREEIRHLQEQLSAKEKKIKSMLEQERIYLTEANNYQANLRGVLDKMKRQQDDLKAASVAEARLKARCEELEKNLAEAQESVKRLQGLEKEVASLREELAGAQREEKQPKSSDGKDELPPAVEKELVDLKVRLEQSQKECTEIKQLYIQITADKRELMSRLEEKESRHENELKTIEKERNEVEALSREYQKTVNILEEREETEKKLLENIAFLESQIQQGKDREAECARLREELAAESIRHQKELERIGKESTASRERLMQLERKSREEFQAQVDAKISVIDTLQKQIDHKNQLLEEYAETLSRLKPATKEAAVETADEGWREKAAALAVQLEKAEERHRHVIETLRREFDHRIATQEKEIKCTHERQLALIAERYKTEVAAIEEQVKEEAAKLLASETTALQEKHAQELTAFVNNMKESKAMYANHVENLKKTLQERMTQMEEFRKKFEGRNSEDVEQLKEQIVSDRNKMAGIMNNWLAEIQKLTEERDALQAKYRALKKMALHYKKEVTELQQRHRNCDAYKKEVIELRQKHRSCDAWSHVKERADKLMKNDEEGTRNSVDEKIFEKQLLDMAAKRRSEKI